MNVVANRRRRGPEQRGVALVVALLFLLVVTIISVVAASNSNLGLKMSTNMQDSYSSFQSAEAGIIAAVATAGTTSDVFDGGYSLNIFDPNSPDYSPINGQNPMRNLNDTAGSVQTDVYITAAETTCPRSGTASSVGLFECDYYRVESEHDVSQKARTKVNLGVVRTIIGSGAR